jgi:hypothetical protein
MTQIELRALLEQIVDEVLQRHPALAGVEVRTSNKRVCDNTHPFFELMLYTEKQREIMPDGERVYRRNALTANDED